MLYVFSVDIGEMYSFEMELAMESVQTLMSAIASTTGIPVDKQVLLVTGGEALDPEDRVCSYGNAGIDTSPIYLFSKSTIESSIPPSTSLNFGSESSLKEQVEVSFKLPPTYETLVSRAQLASNFNHFAMEIASNCEQLVNEQSFQQLGWGAVMSNLDNISKEFNERATTVELSYKEFLESRPRYLQLLQGYNEVLHILAKIPILPGLVHGKHTDKPGMPGIRDGISLLDWISAQDQKNSLRDMVDQCSKALEQFDETILQAVMTDVIQVREALNNSSMKEIKGLDERLLRLQELLQRVKELVQSQAEMAQGFIQNQTRAQNLGDPSVLPDLCTSHQKQLMMLMKNHSQLRDYLRRCARAKEELLTNLHTRLRWIMYVEKKICDSDSTLIIYHENIRRVRRRLEILDQVSEAPRLYMLASSEVARRHKFSSQFMKWASKLHESVCQILSEEKAKREEFTLKFGRHFLQALFTGLDDRPSKFADKLPKSFDAHLPIITEQDLTDLQSIIPEFKEYFDESPINVSMKDFSAEALSMVLKLQDSQMAISQDPVKELSISKTSMSVDTSTQAIWMTDRQEAVGQSQDSAEQIKKNLKDASRSPTDDSASFLQPGEESPPKGYHRDSDTGSEPSSGLTDSDIMFRSAQEDYVTVVESDLESKDVTIKDSSVQSSQTITLTSSGSQSITTSTQTDISLDEKLMYSEILEDTTREKTDSLKDTEAITKLENRINELENELSRIMLDYNKSLQDNEKLVKSNSCLKEFIKTTVVELREDFKQCKDFVTSFKSKMNSDVESAWSDFQGFVDELKGSLSEMSTKTAKEYEDVMKQLNRRHKQETNELMHLKSQLEVEKSAIALELKKVTEEKITKEARNLEEFENLKAMLEEYKTRCDNQQHTLTRQKDIRIKTEEEQQTRFNSIIQSLTKEKKLIVGQLNEKVKEMELEIGKQSEKLKEYENERESFIKEREFHLVGLQERDEKLSNMEARLLQGETKWSQRENEFKSQLEKQKANALLLLEAEKQMWEARNNRQEDTEMTDSSVKLPSEVSSSSTEQKLAQLEKEYKAARENLELQQEAISHALHQFQEGEVNPILHQAKLALLNKDEQIKLLKKQLVQQVKGCFGAEALKPEKVSLKDFQCGDLVLLVFDPRYENYLIFSTGTTLYFLHPDSMAGLDLAISGTKRRDWVLAYLTDKEYCQAKKAQNRFHVPAGTKFYRIQAKPWER